MAACDNCNEDRPIVARGMCARCLTAERDHARLHLTPEEMGEKYWPIATVHYSGTVDGGISCNGYRGELPPGAAHTTNRAHVTCEDCWELMDEHA